MAEQQNYQNHRQWVPLWHYIATPIALIGLLIALKGLTKGLTFDTIWAVVFAIGFAATAYMSRMQALLVQNRLIRLEERLRLREVLPEPMRGRINDLTLSQLIGLRFASDAELAGLVEGCLAGQLKNGEDVKKKITTWRADTLRA
jgi:hypothetical protein